MTTLSPSGRSKRRGFRLQTRLVSAFAGLAIVAVGVFGVLSRLGFERFVAGVSAELDRLPEGGAGGPWGRGFVPFGVLLEAVEKNSGLGAQLNWWTAAAAVAVTAGAVLAGLAIARRIADPLARITQAARFMSQGRLDLRVPPATGEVGELADALNQLAEGLETADQQRRRLLMDVSHELKAPVTGLRGFMEGVQDGVITLDPPTLQAVLGEVDRLQRMIEGLDASVLDGGTPLRRERVDLRALAVTVVATMAGRAETAGLTLVGPAATASAPVLIGDPDRLTQAILNLVDNAIKFTPSGGRVAVEVSTVAADAGAWAEVSVTDTGPGVDPVDLPHLFERFYRGEKSRSRATGGAGIGLAVVREVARAHGGEVGVERAPGCGATFRFRLPLAEA